MWTRFFNLFKLVINFGEDLQKLKETVKQQGQQLNELAANQTRMYYEFQLQRERDAREREREDAARENQQLRGRLEQLEKLLPSATTDKKPDEQ